MNQDEIKALLQKGSELAEEHAGWLKEFTAFIFKEGFKHGFKHGVEELLSMPDS